MRKLNIHASVFTALSILVTKPSLATGYLFEENSNAKTVSIEIGAISPSQRGFFRNFELYNDISFINLCFLFLVIILSLCMARAITIVNRDEHRPQISTIATLVSLLSIILTFSLLVAGFFITKWYWPVLVFLSASIISGLVINGRNAYILYRLNLLVSFIVAAMSSFLLWQFIHNYH